MFNLNVLKVPDTNLRAISEPVNEFTTDIKVILDNMLCTMYFSGGVGLSGNQVGILKRLAVVDIKLRNFKEVPFKLINPEILYRSNDLDIVMEGCLSIPGQSAKVVRSERIFFRYLDDSWNLKEEEWRGMLARCLQHEIDHLNGILFTDHISSIKRSILLRRAMRFN